MKGGKYEVLKRDRSVDSLSLGTGGLNLNWTTETGNGYFHVFNSTSQTRYANLLGYLLVCLLFDRMARRMVDSIESNWIVVLERETHDDYDYIIPRSTTNEKARVGNQSNTYVYVLKEGWWRATSCQHDMPTHPNRWYYIKVAVSSPLCKLITVLHRIGLGCAIRDKHPISILSMLELNTGAHSHRRSGTTQQICVSVFSEFCVLSRLCKKMPPARDWQCRFVAYYMESLKKNKMICGGGHCCSYIERFIVMILITKGVYNN